MTNMQNLIERIRIKINDTASFEFQDNELLSYIHEGLSMLEMLMLSNKVQFNITYLYTASSICPVPEDMLEIHKIVSDNKEMPLKDVTDLSYGLYNNAVIKALSRLEFNMENEKNELMQLSSLIIKTALHKNSIYQMKRYNGYAL